MPVDKNYVLTHKKTLLSYFAIALVITLVIGFSSYWNAKNIHRENFKLALTEAKANWFKDDAFRQWATRHGGVYVISDERTPPSPALAHIPRRDIKVDEETQLTLMNPAYMMRQLTQEFEDLYGIKGKVTGKKQLNPINKPDAWQLKALNLFEQQNLTEFVERTTIDGEPYLRYMKPLFMKEGCMQCHGILGYQVNELRGGVSVSVPLTPYQEAADSTITGMLITHLVVWMILITVLIMFTYAVKRLFNRLTFDALHDDLTGLPNIKLFRNRLDLALQKHHGNNDYLFTVCILDLDRFKHVNDSHGHHVGDQLLQALGKRFTELLRPGDTIARWGGDEFIFLIDHTKTINKALKVIDRIHQTLREPIMLGPLKVYTDASIGVSMVQKSYRSADEMLRDVDMAMYRAKEAGKSQLAVFDPVMEAEVQQRVMIENDLRDAIDKHQLEVYYQPVVHVGSGCIVGFEALLRWLHPQMGYVAPDKFIPIAEHTGQIQALGLWVIDQACRQIQQWNNQYQPSRPLAVAVNLSGEQLAEEGLPEAIQEILERYSLPPQLLNVEVTETMLIDKKDVAKATMDKLRGMGVSISIDDFGTGYCSLLYLQEFNFDTIKIDKSFVQDMTGSEKGHHLVKTLVMLAKSLDMHLVAEGVETQEQLSQLMGMECQLVQGFYFSKPLPPCDIETLRTDGEFKVSVIERRRRHGSEPVVG